MDDAVKFCLNDMKKIKGDALNKLFGSDKKLIEWLHDRRSALYRHCPTTPHFRSYEYDWRIYELSVSE